MINPFSCMKFVVPLVIMLVGSCPASAVELQAGIGYEWWQYSEQDTIPAAFGGGRLDSHAQGWGVAPDVKAMQMLDDWQLYLHLSGLVPFNTTETFPNHRQSDQLSIAQVRTELGFDYIQPATSFGLWSAYNWQQQSRKLFSVGGVRVIPAGREPVHETISVVLVGVHASVSHLFYSLGRLQLNAKAGIPAYVHVTNSLLSISDTFSKRRGWEADAGVSLQMDQFMNTSTDVSFTLRYRYRELGGDAKPSGFWPRNVWQTVLASADLKW